MKWWEILLCTIAIGFCYYGYIKSYSKIFDKKIKKITPFSLFLSILIILLTIINTYYNYSYTKIIISFFAITISYKLFFSENYYQILLKGPLIYILSMIAEFFVGLIVIGLSIENIVEFDKSVPLKILFSILILLITLLICQSKRIKKLLNAIYKMINNRKVIFFLMILLFLVMILITGNAVKEIKLFSYLVQYFIILIFIIFFFILLKQMFEINGALNKEQILLEFIKKYEKILENDRMTRHETINNLLVLKSIKDKNSDEYKKILDDMLNSYQKNNLFKGIGILPAGLKGIIYYKLYDIEELNINFNINASNKSIKKIENLDTITFTKVCKIIGILLENAKEAAEEANNKQIIMDIYEQNEKIEIYIENTFIGKTDISKINTKNYSTKGKGRGLGLYILQDLILDSKNIKFSQQAQGDRFISIVQIII